MIAVYEPLCYTNDHISCRRIHSRCHLDLVYNGIFVSTKLDYSIQLISPDNKFQSYSLISEYCLDDCTH